MSRPFGSSSRTFWWPSPGFLLTGLARCCLSKQDVKSPKRSRSQFILISFYHSKKMCELSEIEATMKALMKQLAKDADDLKQAVGRFVDEAGKKKSSASSSQSSQSTNSQKKKKKTKRDRQPLVDFEIPSCYGTIELRETLARAGKMLTEGIDQLGQTRSRIPSQYVQREMDELATNFTVLKEALIQMWQRMEMNCEDLVIDSPSAPSSAEDVTLQKSLVEK